MTTATATATKTAAKKTPAPSPVTAEIVEVIPFDEKARTGRNRVFVDFGDAKTQKLLGAKPNVAAKPAIEKVLRQRKFAYGYLGWNPNAGGKGVAGFTMDKQTAGRQNVTIKVRLTPAPEQPVKATPATVAKAAGKKAAAKKAEKADVVETETETAPEPEPETTTAPAAVEVVAPELVSTDETPAAEVAVPAPAEPQD